MFSAGPPSLQGGRSIVCGDTVSTTTLSREVFAIALSFVSVVVKFAFVPNKYPWRLCHYYPTVAMGNPTKPDICWPTASKTAKQIVPVRNLRTLPPLAHAGVGRKNLAWCGCHFTVVKRNCLAKTLFKGERRNPQSM
jgi:hypothetical protein